MKFLIAAIFFGLIVEGYTDDTVGYETQQSGYEQVPEDNSAPMSSNGGDQQAYNSDGQDPSDENGPDDNGSTKDDNTEGDKTQIDDNSVGDDQNSGSISYPSGYENKPEQPNPPMSADGGDQLQYQQEAKMFRFTR